MTVLKVDYLLQGVKDKLKVVKDLCSDLDIEICDVAYIGDDINDWQLLKAAGWAGVPCGAPDYIMELANVPLECKGGQGCFREFVEKIIGRDKIRALIEEIVLDRQ